MTKKNLNIFLVKFKNEINFYEIPLFRGAVLNLIGEDVELLFHNHTSETTFRYAYPLIQYKRMHKKAAILCVGNGVESIGQFLSAQSFDINLGQRSMTLEIEQILPKSYLVQTWDTTFHYRLSNWIPLNSKNYQEYVATDSLADRISILEHILIGNLLSFCKGVGIEIEHEIVCQLTSLNAPRIIKVKGTKVMSFDCEFKSNLSLPDHIGLGKHVSLGCGMVVNIHNSQVS
ncbi:MAG: hypothetical protein J6R79_04460 [Bacteroidaceae bacterium]|nr:hypothetical protein [Bacteroidaceae bacterium]